MTYADKIRAAKTVAEMADIICDAPLCRVCDAIKREGRCPGDCREATVKLLEMEVETDDGTGTVGG